MQTKPKNWVLMKNGPGNAPVFMDEFGRDTILFDQAKRYAWADAAKEALAGYYVVEYISALLTYHQCHLASNATQPTEEERWMQEE